MELKNLKDYVERELGHVPELSDLEGRFLWLIQGYHSMKGELYPDDIEYIKETDMETWGYLNKLVPHYELHIMSGPGLGYEIEKSYDFFNEAEAIQEMEGLTKQNKYVRIISVDIEGFFDNNFGIDNFDKVNQKEVK